MCLFRFNFLSYSGRLLIGIGTACAFLLTIFGEYKPALHLRERCGLVVFLGLRREDGVAGVAIGLCMVASDAGGGGMTVMFDNI